MNRKADLFEIIKCSDYCEKVADGTHDSPKATESGKLLITSKNIKNSRLTLETAYFISLKDFDEINKRSKVDKWDLLLTMIGTVGEVCIVLDESPDFAIKNLGLLKTSDELKSKWLYYYLRSSEGKQALNERQKGTTQAYLALGEIRNLPIPIYKDSSLTYKAVKILDSLDKKIDLLNEINRTLESIAQAIFKSWFVDFDPVHAKQQGVECAGIDKATADLFPSSFMESELGFFPKDWERSSMGKVSRVSIGKTPPRKEKEWFTKSNKDIRWLSIRDMGNKFVYFNNSSEYLTRDAINRFNVKVVPDNTVLMSFKMTIGRVGITFGEITTNEAIAHFNLDEGAALTSEYIYLWLKLFNFSTLSSTSSIADAVNSQSVRSIPITIPSKKTLERFQTLISPIFKSIKNNELTIQTLTDIRDTLLPRLISGKLDLSNIEEELEGIA